jgi:hypothetical protein
MSRRISSHIRSNVIAYVALFFALSSGAYAVAIAPKNSVVSKSIKNGQVKTPDIANGAVTGQKVKNGTFAPAASVPTKILVDTSETGVTDLGMVGPYHFTVACTVDTGTNTTTVQTRINGPAGIVDRWGLIQLNSDTPTTSVVHDSVPAATDKAIGTAAASGATVQLGLTGEIETGSTLVSFQLASFVSQGASNQCSVHGTVEAAS